MDTFGKIHGDKREYTYQTARLDRIYITQCMVTKIRSIEHLYKVADHKIVELKIDIENQNIWGKYYWKINKGYFNDSYYRNQISYILMDPYFEDISNFWETAKKNLSLDIMQVHCH